MLAEFFRGLDGRFNVPALAVSLGCAALLIYSVFYAVPSALRRGRTPWEFLGTRSWVERGKEPGTFWFLVICYCLISVLCAVVIVVPLLRPSSKIDLDSTSPAPGFAAVHFWPSLMACFQPLDW